MTLHTKYRPTTFEDVLGQDDAVNAIRTNLDTGQSQAFLLTGPAGTGKTTLARIIASHVGCDDMGISEINAATNTGVDAMRKVIESAAYRSFDASGRKCYIVDECHMLSKAAWNSMLKIIEEPPEHVFWVFCTTELTKVPKTIRTRCVEVELDALPARLIRGLVSRVAEAEGLDVSDEIVTLLGESAWGSPRQALVNLAKVSGADSVEAAERMLRQASGKKEVIDLARCIFGPEFTLANVQKILNDLDGSSPEGIRIVVFSYAVKVWLGSNAQKAGWAAHVMGQFSTECLDSNKIGDIALRCARLLHVKKN